MTLQSIEYHLMKRFAVITGLLAGLFFGVATPFSKLLLEDFNSFQLAGLLYLGAALAMVPFILRKNHNIRLLFQSGNRKTTLGIVFFGGLLGPVLLLAGLRMANAASVSIWLNMELVATALLGVVFFKDSLDKRAWIGVILTLLAGVVTSLGVGMSGLSSGLLIAAACFCWGVDNHLTALSDGASPQAVTFVKGLAAGVVNFSIGCLLSSQSIRLGSIIPALVVGAFSYGLSIVLYVTSAQNIGATRSQILFSTAPLWGVLLSYLFFANTFQWTHLLALALLAMAVLLMNTLSHRHLHTHEVLEHTHFHQHDDGHHKHEHERSVQVGSKGHAHIHRHEAMDHEHLHFPDLHHRHKHTK